MGLGGRRGSIARGRGEAGQLSGRGSRFQPIDQPFDGCRARRIQGIAGTGTEAGADFRLGRRHDVGQGLAEATTVDQLDLDARSLPGGEGGGETGIGLQPNEPE